MKSIILATLCLTVLSAPLSADNEEKDIPTWPHAITNTSDVRNRYHFNLLSPEGLKHIIALAKEVSFKDDRMRRLEAALTERHVPAAQCVRLMELADFDDERLEIVRCVSGRLVDPENIPDILDEFSFTSNRDKALELLRPRRGF